MLKGRCNENLQKDAVKKLGGPQVGCRKKLELGPRKCPGAPGGGKNTGEAVEEETGGWQKQVGP